MINERVRGVITEAKEGEAGGGVKAKKILLMNELFWLLRKLKKKSF